MIEEPYACPNCGATFAKRRAPDMEPSLSKHFGASGHGPPRPKPDGPGKLIRFPKR